MHAAFFNTLFFTAIICGVKTNKEDAMSQIKALVEAKDISYTYQTPEGEVRALENVNMAVFENEFVTIVGPSGCGKSTMLNIIAGSLAPTTGEIRLSGEKINGTDPRIGYMLQKDHLFEWRTILENVLLPLEIRRIKTADSVLKMKGLLEKYGLGEFADAYPSELSGGMRQRCALIRTLATDPGILLLDEPFSALDYQTRLKVADDIYSIIKEQKKTAVMVTHDIGEAISVSDRIFMFSARPATLKRELKIDFDIPLRTPLLCRDAAEFRGYFNTVWKELEAYER